MKIIKLTIKQAKAMNLLSTGSKLFILAVISIPMLPSIMDSAHHWVA